MKLHQLYLESSESLDERLVNMFSTNLLKNYELNEDDVQILERLVTQLRDHAAYKGTMEAINTIYAHLDSGRSVSDVVSVAKGFLRK